MSEREPLHDYFDQLGAMLEELNKEKYPCTNTSEGGSSCLHRAHKLKPGRNGKSQFWYGVECDLPRKKFCDACLMYWWLAVARNLVGNAGKGI